MRATGACALRWFALRTPRCRGRSGTRQKEARRRKIGDYGTAVARAAAVREASVSQLLITHTHLVMLHTDGVRVNPLTTRSTLVAPERFLSATVSHTMASEAECVRDAVVRFLASKPRADALQQLQAIVTQAAATVPSVMQLLAEVRHTVYEPQTGLAETAYSMPYRLRTTPD